MCRRRPRREPFSTQHKTQIRPRASEIRSKLPILSAGPIPPHFKRSVSGGPRMPTPKGNTASKTRKREIIGSRCLLENPRCLSNRNHPTINVPSRFSTFVHAAWLSSAGSIILQDYFKTKLLIKGLIQQVQSRRSLVNVIWLPAALCAT